MNIKFITKIMKLFSFDTPLELTIQDISKKSHLSYNATYRTIQYLLKREVLNIKKIGKASVISLNPTELTLSFLLLAAYQKPIKFSDKEKFLQKFAELKNHFEIK